MSTITNPGADTFPCRPRRAALLLKAGRAAELLLAVVFLWAGVAKLMDPNEARRALYAVGFPLQSVTFIAYGAAFVDVLLGCLLVSNGLRRSWPAIAMAVVLAGYTGFLVVLMNTSDAPDCGCFGSSSSATAAEASWWPVARNGGLLGLCAIAAMTSFLQRRKLL